MCPDAQVLSKGVPDDAMPGIRDKQVPLPDTLNNFNGLYNSQGSKVRHAQLPQGVSATPTAQTHLNWHIWLIAYASVRHSGICFGNRMYICQLCHLSISSRLRSVASLDALPPFQGQPATVRHPPAAA